MQNPVEAPGAARYDPTVFHAVNGWEAAKRIILTPEQGRTTDERWRLETPHLADLIADHIGCCESDVVLDFGCGIGRMARELIKRHNCSIIGADISPSMRALAAAYCPSERFAACHPQFLSTLTIEDTADFTRHVRFDTIIAVWVLQHVMPLDQTLDQLQSLLKPRGKLFVVNEASYRCVPTNIGWIDDGAKVREGLNNRFHERASGRLDEKVVGVQSERTFWAVYSN